MEAFLEKVLEVLTMPMHYGWGMMLIYLLMGWVASILIRKLFSRLEHSGRMPVKVGRLLSKFVRVVLWLIVIIQGLRAVGVDLVGILGAAGVAGVAIGFASQTALSNLISGLFLITERSIRSGDYVRINDLEGTVESINLLSIYIRQPDNALIRIPCESIIKNSVINYTRTNIRRSDFLVGVDYSTRLEDVEKVVRRVVESMNELPQSPEPVVQFVGFGESSLDVRIGVWCPNATFHASRYKVVVALMKAFGEAGISIPFPIRDVRLAHEGK